MKKYVCIITMVLALPNICLAQQTKSNTTEFAKTDSLLQECRDLLDNIDNNGSVKNRYKLYSTENIYNMLQLDTKTGQIKQAQWSLDNDKEGCWTINDEDLSYGVGYGSGSFELYPTKNMYQFILLDKTDGRKWHVQWGIGDSKRWIRKID